MSRRKGEISTATIDRKWPHQVALHAEICTDDQFHLLDAFAATLGVAPRDRIVTKLEPTGYQQRYNLFCFATREGAEAFIARFGGRHFDPVADRVKPKQRNVWTWEGWGEPAERHREIIARLERVRSWEPPLDADIAWLLGIPQGTVRFTRERAEVEAFLAERLPQGEWEASTFASGFDARLRHGPGAPWHRACEGITRPRDNEATALTLAFLRGWTVRDEHGRDCLSG